MVTVTPVWPTAAADSRELRPVLVSATMTACLAALPSRHSPSLQHDFSTIHALFHTCLHQRRRRRHRGKPKTKFVVSYAGTRTLSFSLHRLCMKLHLFPRMCMCACEVSLRLHLRVGAENKHGLHHSLWPCSASRPRPRAQRSVEGKPLIGWDVAQPGEVVMATWFYLDHYSHCDTTINSLYFTL